MLQEDTAAGTAARARAVALLKIMTYFIAFLKLLQKYIYVRLEVFQIKIVSRKFLVENLKTKFPFIVQKSDRVFFLVFSCIQFRRNSHVLYTELLLYHDQLAFFSLIREGNRVTSLIFLVFRRDFRIVCPIRLCRGIELTRVIKISAWRLYWID